MNNKDRVLEPENKRISLIIFAHTGRQSAIIHTHKSQGWISFYDFKNGYQSLALCKENFINNLFSH